jgi:acyl dehydratase
VTPDSYTGRWRARDAVPGARIVHGGGRTLGRDEQLWLAWATGNASAVHGNADVAARGRFADVIVLGALTVAVVAGLAEPEPGSPEDSRSLLHGGWTAIQLAGPVAPGDTLTAVSDIVSVERGEGDGVAIVTREILGHNQRSEIVVRLEETRRVAW